MEQGAIPVAELEGSVDLQSTVESGQSYLWDRLDGKMYTTTAAYGGSAWYETVVPPIPGVFDQQAVVRIRQHNGELQWESTTDAVPIVQHLLRLDDDLQAIKAAIPDDPLLERAFEQYAGMRLVRDPVFPCLISFICSAQMRVSRIFGMQRRLAREYGEEIEFNGETYHAFPTPEQMAERSEGELRDLSLGYRAPYVQKTAKLVATGEVDPRAALDLEYEKAREHLTQFVGVGNKVADCVLLFSLGFTEAVPLDTWIQTAIAEQYPDCDQGGYVSTSRAIRKQFGGQYAGYAQTYVFHYLRNGGN